MCFIINTECACGCYAFVSEHKCTPPCPAEDPKVIRTVVLAHDCRRPGHCPRVDAYWAWMFNNQLASAEHWQEYVKLAESKKLNEMDRLEVLSTWHYADAFKAYEDAQGDVLANQLSPAIPSSSSAAANILPLPRASSNAIYSYRAPLGPPVDFESAASRRRTQNIGPLPRQSAGPPPPPVTQTNGRPATTPARGNPDQADRRSGPRPTPIANPHAGSNFGNDALQIPHAGPSFASSSRRQPPISNLTEALGPPPRLRPRLPTGSGLGQTDENKGNREKSNREKSNGEKSNGEKSNGEKGNEGKGSGEKSNEGKGKKKEGTRGNGDEEEENGVNSDEENANDENGNKEADNKEGDNKEAGNTEAGNKEAGNKAEGSGYGSNDMDIKEEEDSEEEPYGEIAQSR
ncbi:hypothetical protein SMACR_00618 [Sordaria macrospora]|uniref:WGS project CABT00000000 data, contig 2.1 n=2 Tax=Sordaria macrospora TaxID=5147 RepID=F7VLM5_SORMK|nr:uncharacterized protein SMAC_00618 [Sordaria macrospora k-hell]KAA8633337.1 hypothetical protein SMACR_00618 [Sordaria macrospora]WPJ59370.1 hypothetical protein SMAC4_00618 [Sordaria macrospora]CCC06403.1 unnamed protein product [Sordaria macrospora k-hell]